MVARRGRATAVGLAVAWSVAPACTPEPLGFAAGDAGGDAQQWDGAAGDAPSTDGSAGDSAIEQDAVPDALTPPTVYLLVRPTVADPTVDQLRTELQGFGIAFTELLPSEVASVDASRSVFIAGFSTKSASWGPVAPALMAAVSAGSWILLEGFALYLLDDGAVEGVETGNWGPGCKDASYFVAPIAPETTPLFTTVSTWDPPEAPDKPTQALWTVITPGTQIPGATLVGDGTGWSKAEFWYLAATPGCQGLNTSSSYCTSWGQCTLERSVLAASVLHRSIGLGRAAWINVRPVVPGVFAWGPATGLLHRNFIQWAIAEVSKN
jgi:hypothetical protein